MDRLKSSPPHSYASLLGCGKKSSADSKEQEKNVPSPPKRRCVSSGSVENVSLIGAEKVTKALVRLTNSGLPTFDFQFATSDNSVLEVLRQEAVQRSTSELVIVQSVDGLDRDNLTRRLTLDSQGRHKIKPGKLFDNPLPVTLVLDLRNMAAADVGSFNDLIDRENSCLYDHQQRKKVSVGSHVHILVLASLNQLPDNRSTPKHNALGADFWSRINHQDNQWQSSQRQSQSVDTDCEFMEVDDQGVLPSSTSSLDSNQLTIDLHKSSDWRRTLYGGAGVDSSGRIQHIPGALEQLLPGQHVVLKGADWSDLEFRQQITELNRKRTFEANGQLCSLPDGVKFFQAALADGELVDMCQHIDVVDEAPENRVIINQENLAQWLNPVKINEAGTCLPNQALEARIGEGATLTITSSLTGAQWFVLLDHLQGVQQKTGNKIPVFLASSTEQPEALMASGIFPTTRPIELPQCYTTQVVRCNSDSQIEAWIKQQPHNSLVIRVNANTRLNQLFDNLHVQSERTPRFGIWETDLQKALFTGRPVLLLGLETNPALQRNLETLLCVPAGVLVHGHWLAYPNSHLRVLWPDTATPCSVLWEKAIAVSEEVMDLDIWSAATVKHQLTEGEIPQNAIQKLYEAYRSVPAKIRHSIGELPPLTAGLLDNLVYAAQQERLKDGVDKLQPCHWRKALNRVLNHTTRRVSAVSDFMKVACSQLLPDEWGNTWVDPDQLTKKLPFLKTVDQKWVENNFWSLARACGPELLGNMRLEFESVPSGACGVIHGLLAVYAPEPLRQSLKLKLQPDPEQLAHFEQQSPPIRSMVRIKRLVDALFSGWQLLHVQHSSSSHSQKVAELAAKACEISRHPDLDATSRNQELCAQLSVHLHWCGQGVAPFEQLAADLLAGQTCQRDREQRRLERLKERLAISPVVFIDGDTGTGKSYFASRIAHRTGPTFILTTGPSTEEKDILQGWAWQDDDEDRHMILQKKTLLDWAKARIQPSGGQQSGNQFITLVIDEANLPQKGLLSTLKGLWNKPPCIYCDGHPVLVSDRHRVILTGNPADYAGRRIESSLIPALLRVHYPRLNECFLLDRVVTPTLSGYLDSQSGSGAAQTAVQTMVPVAANQIMLLWSHYQKLLPERAFTPRDLTDICSWINWYISNIESMSSQTQMSALILQSFRDVLGQECDNSAGPSLLALESWFSAQQPVDENFLESVKQQVLAQTHRCFQQYASEVRPEFDTSSQAVFNLAHALEQDLSRRLSACRNDQPHGGRQATLIEGPTGRGKDVTLRLIIESFQRQKEPINSGHSSSETMLGQACFVSARDCPWDKLCEHIHRAQREGSILVISEMNLIDSSHLEGELNDILAGTAESGFHLFATVNPPSDYVGRQPLSPALLGRFRRIPVYAYSESELTAIASKKLAETGNKLAKAALLAGWHCRMREAVQGCGITMHPTGRELQRLAIAVKHTDDQEELKRAFEKYYRVYLLASGVELETLLKREPVCPVCPGKTFDLELTRWLNFTVKELEKPFCVYCEGVKGSINLAEGVITIPPDLNAPAAKKEIIRQLALARWQESGMPLEGPNTQDSLKLVMYKFWQRLWFQHWIDTLISQSPELDEIDIKAEDVFPMEEVHRLTERLPVNQPYLHAVRRLIEGQISCETLEWPALWQKIERILDSPVSSFQEKSETTTQKEKKATHAPTPVQLPHATEKKLDRKTRHSTEVESSGTISQLFAPSRNPNLFRLEVCDIQITHDGNITETRCGRGEYGLEVVKPVTIMAESPALLTEYRTYGINTIDIAENQYYYLAGLEPDDKLIALRTEPEVSYNIVRDRYTGLHMICFSELNKGDRNNQNRVKIHYILETTPAFLAREEMSYTYLQPVPRKDTLCPDAARRIIQNLLQQDQLRALSPQVQEGLMDIDQAVGNVQRVASICKFCQDFEGHTNPDDNQDLLTFLLTQRQGTIEHRTCVFILLCRYYGIPARYVKSQVNVFPEYSQDGGHTWLSTSLGGTSGYTAVTPCGDFPPQQVARSAMNPQMAAWFRNMSEEQLALLARSLGMTTDQLHSLGSYGVLDTQGASGVSQEAIVDKLLREKTPHSFAMATDLLETIEDPSYEATRLLGHYDDWDKMETLAMAAIASMTSSDDEESLALTVERLERLHEKAQSMNMREEWGRVTLALLEELRVEIIRADDTVTDNKRFIAFLQWVLEKKWLLHFVYYLPANETLNFLHLASERYTCLTPLLTQHIQAWYQQVLAQDLSSDYYVSSFSNTPLPVEMQGRHGGHSQSLEEQLRIAGISRRWSHEPEGVPEVERLLAGQSAFSASGANNRELRPVIWQVTSSWRMEVFQELVQPLLDLYDQEAEEDSTAIRDRIRKHPSSTPFQEVFFQAPITAFCHYLYETICREGGSLTLAWSAARDCRFGRIHYGSNTFSGSCLIHSDKQLSRLVNCLHASLAHPQDKPYIRQAFHMPNALVIMPEDIARYAREFVEHLGMYSLYQEFRERLLAAPVH